MTHSRTALLPRYTFLAIFVCLAAMTGVTRLLQAEQTDSTGNATAPWKADQVTHLIGLPEMQPKMKGSLSLSSTALVFTTPGGHTSIERAEILSVTVGDVRVESGGTAGKITRAVIPFGGGAAVATVTHKQIGLLTVEFRDRHNALHGAVFLLPKDEAAQAEQQFGSSEARAQAEQPNPSCPTAAATASNTLQVAPITTDGEPIPAEYRVLVYEQLVQRLREGTTFAGIYRYGENTPFSACPQYNLTLTLSAFNKGNAALRASTGPVGLFVGATSLKFHAIVRDLNGTVLLDKDFKVSKRGDTDSLDVTDKIARSLAKTLKKASTQAGRD